MGPPVKHCVNHHGASAVASFDTEESLVLHTGGNDNNNMNRKQRNELLALVLPWMSIVAVACMAGIFLSVTDNGDEDSTTTWQGAPRSRDLWENEYSDEVSHHAHKPVYNEDHAPLFPLTTSDYYGVLLAIAGLMIAAGGGIGGGGILVPLYILVMGFSPKHAIPLSNVTVFGGAVANTLLNSYKRHPVADRPCIDWDLILVMEPLTIAGALAGAFLNKILPERLLTILLVMLLSVTAQKTLQKAIRMYKAETRKMRLGGAGGNSKEAELIRSAARDEQEGEDQEELLKNMEENDNEEEDEGKKDAGDIAQVAKDPLQEELEQILEDERHTPATNVSILVTMFIVVLAINLLKGGGAFPSPLGIRCGSTAFWMANAIMLGWIFAISWHVRQYLLNKYEAKQRCGYEYVEGDIQWDRTATLKYPAYCCFAGFFAGMFGIGGGIVKGPLMLSMGVHPAVSSASSACMILFTSFTATTSFVVFGLLVPDYAAVALMVGFFATLLGQVGLSYLMKKAQRNSYIAFSIGFVVLLSAFLMTVQSLLSMAAHETHHAGGICGKGD